MGSRYVRVIPRLDIKGPNVVKGIQFDGFRVVGAPQSLAEVYYLEGADELIFQDTVASLYRRNSLLEIIRETARKVFIPLTVAGGIRKPDDIREILRAGADKVAINTAAVEEPRLLRESVRIFGSQCIVASIEAHRASEGRYEVWTDYGRQRTRLDAEAWAQQVVELGVGEILLTSIDREGTGRGYDLDLTRRIAASVPVPVIACGGAGCGRDLAAAARDGGADAVSAASVFHYYYLEAPEESSLRDRYQMRFGRAIDTGNVDFLREGYGGSRAIPVTPASIPEAKLAMQQQGIATRMGVEHEEIHVA